MDSILNLKDLPTDRIVHGVSLLIHCYSLYENGSYLKNNSWTTEKKIVSIVYNTICARSLKEINAPAFELSKC